VRGEKQGGYRRKRHAEEAEQCFYNFFYIRSQALLESENINRLKASITVIVSDYSKIRYAHEIQKSEQMPVAVTGR